VVVDEGLGIREVERNLGITHGVLKDWVQKHRDQQYAAFAGRVAPESPEAEQSNYARRMSSFGGSATS
jgi:transposase